MCNEIRFLKCPCCDGEGLIYTASCLRDEYGNQMERSDPCNECNGTGSAETPVEPITIEDLDAGGTMTAQTDQAGRGQ